MEQLKEIIDLLKQTPEMALWGSYNMVPVYFREIGQCFVCS